MGRLKVEKKIISVYLTMDQIQFLKVTAEKEDRSITNLLSHILSKHIRETTKEKEKEEVI